jgi:DNA primase
MNKNLPDVREVLRDYVGISIPANGGKFECPFHNDTSKDSMKHYPDSNTLYCFGACSKSYDPIEVVSSIKGIGRKAAYEELQKKYHLKQTSIEEERLIYITRILENVVSETKMMLTEEHKQLLYRRGVTDESIEKYRIGYMPEDIFSSISVSEEELKEAGIVYLAGNDNLASNFVDKILIPLYNESFELVTLAGWNYNGIDGEPKYAYPKGLKKPIVGDMSNDAFLVEGVFDLIIMQQQGFKTFSFLGLKPTKEQLNTLKEVTNIKILLDGDEAGKKQGNELASTIYPNATLLELPENHDPNSYYLELGVDFNKAIQDMVDNAEDLIDKNVNYLSTFSDKREAAKFLGTNIIPLLGKLDKTEQEIIISDIAHGMGKPGFTKAAIKEQIKEYNSEKSPNPANEDTNMTTILYERIKNNINLFKNKADVIYVRVQVDKHQEIYPINDDRFKRYLRREARKEFGKIVSAEVINGVKSELEADGDYEGQAIELENRIAKDEEAFYYDLTDAEHRVIKVTQDKWTILNHPEPFFKREAHQIPQVDPDPKGDIKEILSLFPKFTYNQKLLYQVFLVYCLVPGVPKVIMYVQGEKGSGKSDFTKVTRQLIDPSVIESLNEPRVEDRVIQQLQHHYVALFDNVNVMHDWFTRLCCTAVTGESDEKRQLFTDDGAIIFKYMRVIIINAINRLGINFPDFQDRIQLFKMTRIPPTERMEREDFWKRFNEMRERVLGGMFNTLVKAMRIKPTVNLTEKPRMADYAVWGCAIAEALGYTQEQFLKAYSEIMEEANMETIENHPIANAIVEFMKTQRHWKGKASDLLERLDDIALDLHIDTKQRIWAKSPSALSMRLNEINSNLLDVGIKLTRDKETGSNASRYIEFTNTAIKATAGNSELIEGAV